MAQKLLLRIISVKPIMLYRGAMEEWQMALWSTAVSALLRPQSLPVILPALREELCLHMAMTTDYTTTTTTHSMRLKLTAS